MDPEDRAGPGGLVDVVGVISADELKNATSSLSTLDQNKDGQLTEEEYRPQGGRGGAGGPGGARGGDGPPDRRDTAPGNRGPGDRPARGADGDRPAGRGPRGPGGAGGPGEGPDPERMLTHALEFDADKDGKLSKDELKKFIEDFISRHPGPGGNDEPGGRGPRGGRDMDGERSERPRRPE